MSDREFQIDHGFSTEPFVEPSGVKAEPPKRVPVARAEAIPFPAISPLESEAATSPELRPISEFLRALARAVKSARMYPTNNPIYLKSVTDLVEKLNRAFQEFNMIRVVVGQTRLFFQGEPIYENADPEDSLSRLFFRDGIREISFHIGLDRDEMARLLEMIRAAQSREATDDLVTQLWDGSLPHITYTAIDDMLDADLSDTAVPAEFGSDFMNYVDFEMDFTDDEAQTPEPTRDEALAAAGEMHRKLMESPDRGIIAVTDEESRAIQAETAHEDPWGLMTRVLDTFFDVLELEQDEGAREQFLVIIESVLVSVVAQKQFASACHILKSLDDMVTRRPDLARAHEKTLKSIQHSASDIARLESITDILERTTGSMADEIERYMRYLSPEAIPELIDVLGRLESRRGRRVMCNVLIDLSKGRIDAFLPYLKDQRWYLVRNVLGILGQMKASAAVKHIRPLVSHAEIRVRREALTALSLIGEREAVEALVASLKDSDARIRVSAARSLSRLGKAGLNPILQVVLAKDFESRSFEERRGFFDALGRTNSPEILQYLKMLLGKKPMFKKNEADEMKVCAVEALSRMKLPEVKALLADAAKDASSIVRAAVTGATRRHEEDDGDDV